MSNLVIMCHVTTIKSSNNVCINVISYVRILLKIDLHYINGQFLEMTLCKWSISELPIYKWLLFGNDTL